MCSCERPVISAWLPLIAYLRVKTTPQTSSLFSFCRLLIFSSLKVVGSLFIKTPAYACDRDSEGQQVVMLGANWLWNVCASLHCCDPFCINIIVGCLLQLSMISILWNPQHPYMLCETASRELDLSVSAACVGEWRWLLLVQPTRGVKPHKGTLGNLSSKQILWDALAGAALL